MRFSLPNFQKVFLGPKISHLGIDIGTSAIKVVEFGAARGKPVLLNYGELRTFGYLKYFHESPQSAILRMPEQEIAARIKMLLETAGITNRKASMSIPLFSAFFTTVELPPMNKAEAAEAITYEARQVVPVPLAEVILDWEILGRVGKIDRGVTKEKLLVLLVAVPREVVDRTVRIAKLAAIELDALEVEAFSSVRAVCADDRRITILVDIGARATSLLLVDEGTIRMSHSLDSGGSDLTAAFAHTFRIDVARAETMKLERGIGADNPPEVQQVLATIMGRTVSEVERLANAYQRSFGKQVERLVLSGGSSTLPGIAEHFSSRLRLPVALAEPFLRVQHPPELASTLRELGPPFAVAAGLSLRRFAHNYQAS